MKEFTINPGYLNAKNFLQKNDLPTQKNLFYRTLRHPYFRPYIRLIIFTLFMNGLVFIEFASSLTLNDFSNIILLNFGIGVFLRQHELINLLFKVATSVPKSWPLSIRWAAGKVYHFGGIHVGSFLSGSIWFAYFLMKGYLDNLLPTNVLFIGMFHLLVLSVMMIVALPQIRMPHHNLFEKVARFGAWTSLALFWIQGILLNDINFIGLSFITACLIKPWLHLKKVDIKQISPSGHVAISKFNYGVTPFAGSSTELSTNPLLEWHSFANAPSPNKEGFRLFISRAGDWTGDYIDKLPKKIWIRGIPAAGVGNIEKCFKKVIWVATGSGIGPCLPHLIDPKVPSRIIWSTRSPRETYGDNLVDEILSVQPDAVIWDTTKKGKPDLLKLAYEEYKDFDAEAIIVISNKKVTFNLNYELESRGIPAFGAIWDS
jgi:hypothetical protein